MSEKLKGAPSTRDKAIAASVLVAFVGEDLPIISIFDRISEAQGRLIGFATLAALYWIPQKYYGWATDTFYLNGGGVIGKTNNRERTDNGRLSEKNPDRSTIDRWEKEMRKKHVIYTALAGVPSGLLKRDEKMKKVNSERETYGLNPMVISTEDAIRDSRRIFTVAGVSLGSIKWLFDSTRNEVAKLLSEYTDLLLSPKITIPIVSGILIKAGLKKRKELKGIIDVDKAPDYKSP